MPDLLTAPPPIFAAEFDATEWSGVEVFRRGEGDAVTLPEFGDGEGIYRDAVDFLNGFGTAQSLTDDLFGTDITIGLDANDRITLTNGAESPLAIIAHPGNAWWGFPTNVNVAIEPDETYTAPREWKRGPLFAGTLAEPPVFRLQLPGFGFPVGFPLFPAWVQSIPATLRTRGSVGDIDDSTGLDALEELDNAANDDANARIRWAVVNGRVAWSAATTADAIEWLDTAFRDRLGFDGTEPLLDTAGNGGVGAVPSGHTRYQIANRLLPGWVAPTRPARRFDRFVEVEGDALRLLDGSYSTTHDGAFYGWEVDTRIDGPLSPFGDLSGHYLDLLAEWAQPGRPLTVYQGGDTRRGPTPESPIVGYGLTYTAEQYRGRLLCRVHPDTRRRHVAGWDSSTFRLRSPASLVLSDREEGV